MIRQRLHGKTTKIFGPPGTGKTHQLLERIKWFIKNGVHPSQIAYFSFTNKAVDETIMRLKLDLPDYTEDDFPYFSTIHSFARRQFAQIPVLDPNEDMLQFHSDYGTIKINAARGFEDQKVFNNWSLQIYDRARNTKQDPVDLYKKQDRKEVRLAQFQSNAIPGEDLKNKLNKIKNVQYKENIFEAIKSIPVKKNDLILITGSLYLAGEVLNLN